MTFLMPFSIRIPLTIPIQSHALQFSLNSTFPHATAAICQSRSDCSPVSTSHLSYTIASCWIHEDPPSTSLSKSLMNILKNGGSRTDTEGTCLIQPSLCQWTTGDCSERGWFSVFLHDTFQQKDRVLLAAPRQRRTAHATMNRQYSPVVDSKSSRLS